MERPADTPVQTEPVNQDTKTNGEGAAPVNTKEAEEGNSSEAMETDAPEQKPTSA